MDEHARTPAGLVRRMEMTNSIHPGVGRCKHIIRHDAASLARLSINPTQEPAEGAGSCLFKTWGLIPVAAAKVVLTMEGEQPLCLREIGSTVYQYRPTDEGVRRTRARAVR